MTIDECLDKLCDGRPTLDGLASVSRPYLEALVYTESERAAGVVDEARDHNVRHRLGYKIADALAECRDEILRSSPGKVGG